MNAETVEEMRKELEAAGYEILSCGAFPNDKLFIFQYEADAIIGYNETIQKAYAHYQQQKQHEAMRALLEEIFADGDSVCRAIHEQQPMATGADFTFDLPMTFNRMVKIKQLLESMKG